MRLKVPSSPTPAAVSSLRRLASISTATGDAVQLHRFLILGTFSFTDFTSHVSVDRVAIVWDAWNMMEWKPALACFQLFRGASLATQRAVRPECSLVTDCSTRGG